MSLDCFEAKLAVVDEKRIVRLDRGEYFRMRQLHAVGVAWRRVGIEREILTGIDFGRSVLESADAQFRTLQIDQDADRPAMFGFDGANRRHQFAHALGIGVAHIDAEDVGACRKQPLNRDAI